MSIWPVVLDLNGSLEPLSSVFEVPKLLVGTSKIEDTSFVVAVKLQSLGIAVKSILILFLLVENHTLMVPVICVHIDLSHLFDLSFWLGVGSL